MNVNNWINKNCKSLDNKTICITGSTGGLSTSFVDVLAKLGANLIFANRNLEKSEIQKQNLIKKYPNIKIQILSLDLFDIESVKNFCVEIKSYKVDIFIFNAGIYNEQREMSRINYNNIFQVNFISPYYIIKQLLPNLTKETKLIVVGSIAYNFSKVDFSDIQKLNTKNPNKIYGNSKRFLMYSLLKLSEEKNLNLTIVHPGITLTNMTSHYHKSMNWLIKIMEKLMFQKPEKACLSVLAGIFTNTNSGEWIGPSRFNIWGYPKKQKLKNFTSDEATKIYNIAEQIYNKMLTKV